jgi:crotonobetainyl-CoA:carnitine CoA-transferase CaiB-like acyl-CoA transferase
MLREHPRLVWCTITGFGPDSVRPGYDFVVQAEAGWMAITGPADGAPHKMGVALADVIAGKDAATAILAALVGRERLDAAARALDVSLMGSATAALVNVAQNVLVSGAEARRWGNAHPNLVPYELFEAADRPFVIAVGSDPQWVAAARALGLDALADDPALATNAGRLAQRERVVRLIGERARTAPAAVWIAALDAAGVPCGVVRSVTEALAAVGGSPVTGVTPPAGGAARLPPPGLDAHGPLIRRHHWSAFDHVPILASDA